MKTDTYTKAILTVIAACLVWMCVTRDLPAAQAQVQPQAQAAPAQPSPPVRVILVDQLNRPIYTTQGLLVNVGEAPVPVQVTNPAVPVTLNAVQQTGAWDPVLVRMMREPPTPMPVP
jgi:hypothetical protein